MNIEIAGGEEPAGIPKGRRIPKEAEYAANSREFGGRIGFQKRSELGDGIDERLARKARRNGCGFGRLDEWTKH